MPMAFYRGVSGLVWWARFPVCLAVSVAGWDVIERADAALRLHSHSGLEGPVFFAITVAWLYLVMRFFPLRRLGRQNAR